MKRKRKGKGLQKVLAEVEVPRDSAHDRWASIVCLLECGHRIKVKKSAKQAWRRHCPVCDGLVPADPELLKVEFPEGKVGSKCDQLIYKRPLEEKGAYQEPNPNYQPVQEGDVVATFVSFE